MHLIWEDLQCSFLENPMDRGAWWAAVHGVTKSQTRLSDFTFILLWSTATAEPLANCQLTYTEPPYELSEPTQLKR